MLESCDAQWCHVEIVHHFDKKMGFTFDSKLRSYNICIYFHVTVELRIKHQLGRPLVFGGFVLINYYYVLVLVFHVRSTLKPVYQAILQWARARCILK